ncbi:ligase-associated DNA damage response endonuclease PdeM [Reyranella sp. CPCC 100927]|uniref:ligase-associated DNA damage response endonuclease PdeM n=1 Tax=Reyranella sp. CPCC 100927 TaxID=2599616 RepID=UPI0011B84518|nr:ligase-associated DNA damage response endonuclease PdeM [Reyranella sp. CPCC 100927]TWT12749.1 ligase-associated DNA damage response endonuclease PdeM [Reyranella sp. CPCC 100927]
MSSIAFAFNGAVVEACADGALWWPDERLLAVADLHLEKGTWYGARTGQLLPPYDTRTTLDRLARCIAVLRPRTVVCVGDSFHDTDAAARIDAGDAATLARLIAAVGEWIWLVGNHDPHPPREWGGMVSHELAFGPLAFRHEADRTPLTNCDGEISGHYHPVAVLTVRGRGLRRRCFVTDGRRLILPSFGAYTGGLNARDPAIAELFDDTYDVLALGAASVHRLSSRILRPDAVMAELVG